MSSPFVPIETADLDWCSDLPLSRQFDDIYNSIGNGMMQSRYVFIEGNDLINRWSALPENELTQFNIGETGFGTGLNFLLTWNLWEQYAPTNANLHFISCEKHPLKLNDLKKCLSVWPDLSLQSKELIKHYPVLTQGYHHLSFGNGRVKLTLMLGDAQDCFEQLLVCGDSQLESNLRSSFIDAWYLDGFAPSKNEEMWSPNLCSIIAMLSKPDTSFATYTAAASVKSALKNAGFHIIKRKGFGPKRHMLTGLYKSICPVKLRSRQTPWHTGSPQKHNNKSAHIVGGGLAGCFLAYCLAKKGWKVTLFEEHGVVGCGASANQQAVLFPKLSAFKSPLTQLMLSAFLYAAQFYKSFIKQFPDLGCLNGSLILAYNEKECNAQNSLFDWLQYYPELGLLTDQQQSSDLSGLNLERQGLFVPLSGWINSPQLCKCLISNEAITLISNATIDGLQFNGSSWIINETEADVVVLCNGYKVNSFKETHYLPVKAIRGQMSSVDSTMLSSNLKIPVCAEGHVLPAHEGVHHFGASYNLGESTHQTTDDDDQGNLIKLNKILPDIWSNTIVQHWAGVRASTPDYIPLVGPVVNPDEFIESYAPFQTNSKRWIAKEGPYIHGLYVFSGFGSRGLTTIPLCAEWLASQINNELSILPRHLVHALSPSRFLKKNITRDFNKSKSIFVKDS